MPTRVAPKFGLRVLAMFDGSVKMILPAVGKEIRMDNSKVRAGSWLIQDDHGNRQKAEFSK